MFGFTFDTRTPSSVEILALGQREKYEILHVIEFTSTRKRMSVIARTPDNKIKLYCKVRSKYSVYLQKKILQLASKPVSHCGILFVGC